MPLVDSIKHFRDEKKFNAESLLYFTTGWLRKEAKDRPRTYTSAEVLELLEVILENNETPAAGTVGESR